MKKITGKTSQPDQHFINAAELLVASYKKPTDFLCFLTEAISWAHEYALSLDKKVGTKDSHFNFVVIIDEIVVPWINSIEETRIETIANGIKKLQDFSGYEGHHETMGTLMSAYS